MLRAKQSSLTNAASKFCVAARLWLSVTGLACVVVLILLGVGDKFQNLGHFL
jgi:hypothetical protein